ncbi:primosomal protein DnaT [Buchnera aphidicola (Pemphigus obesinymphae)]|uniref:primosomal protein DnaT n=1 Tax=Buchnera aphidicola TaxID=9 RepID=UPI0022388801|nr:primosomal protein DnaT [Buchnera aphidicola]MCW5196839.1 primosomal protein DnaT [Buchnera aphidicola (Pemphigus obesinymphae)]
MPIKILVPTATNLTNFKKDPISALSSAKEGALAILQNNIPIMYAVTPSFLNKLFSINNLFQEQKKNIVKKNIINKTYSKNVPMGKFTMYQEWKPDPDFLKQAAIWGITLHSPISHSELALFISYWQAEGKFFHHVQWQQKLARSVQQSRILNTIYKKRNINDLPKPDKKTPEGFRGQ